MFSRTETPISESWEIWEENSQYFSLTSEHFFQFTSKPDFSFDSLPHLSNRDFESWYTYFCPFIWMETSECFKSLSSQLMWDDDKTMEADFWSIRRTLVRVPLGHTVTLHLGRVWFLTVYLLINRQEDYSAGNCSYLHEILGEFPEQNGSLWHFQGEGKNKSQNNNTTTKQSILDDTWKSTFFSVYHNTGSFIYKASHLLR